MKTNCIIWTGYKDRAGYGTVHHDGKLRKAHRIAYCQANNISIETINGLCVRHTCDNPSCVNPEHLLLGTGKQNVADRIVRNRSHHPNGAKNNAVKLTREQVEEIRAKYIPRKKGFNAESLAKEYGVSPTWIGRIVAGSPWKDVPEKSLFLTFEGKTLTPYDWAKDERVQLTARGIIERKRRGLSDAEALFAPKCVGGRERKQ